MNRFVCTTSIAVAFMFACSVEASQETIGPKGINSVATGLTGMGIGIGQVEPARPGKHGYDTDANCCNDKVVPSGVLELNNPAGVNQSYNDHALWVASVMISKQNAVSPPGVWPPVGVAPDAALFSSAFLAPPFGDLNQSAAISAQAVAPLAWATNMSFAVPQDGDRLDGSSTLSAFVDWSTVRHEVLYVVAGNQITNPNTVPTDNFNGITVAGSGRHGVGVFRRVADFNVYGDNVDAFGDRTSTDILAPGELIDVAGANGSQPSAFDSTGTSYAAPHVTGTLALLHQQATTTNARRHQVMKAVVLNSADKIKDIIGMERTVVKSGGGGDWFGSDAHSDPNIPLDRQMGAGHLNAKRAVQQHAAGEHSGGGVLIGWDYAVHNDPFIPNTYSLSLNAGDFVSATLVWDRNVFLNSPFLDYERGDEFIDFGFADLNLYLVRAGQAIEQAVASSTSTAWNLEHIFASVEDAGDYQLLVTTSELNDVPYAIAWWAGADARPDPGDFNRNGSVDAADYVVWREDDGSQEGYEEWRANFGNTSGSGSAFAAAVPEPATWSLLSILAACWMSPRRPRLWVERAYMLHS